MKSTTKTIQVQVIEFDDWEIEKIIGVLKYARHRISTAPEAGIKYIISKEKIDKLIKGFEGI